MVEVAGMVRGVSRYEQRGTPPRPPNKVLDAFNVALVLLGFTVWVGWIFALVLDGLMGSP